MDYFQGVVSEYLRANRQTFVNPELYLPLAGQPKTAAKGSSWFVDIVAIDIAKRTAFLCEVSYSKGLSALLRKMREWAATWPKLVEGLRRVSDIPEDWAVRPWLFIPEERVSKFVKYAPRLPVPPLITTLEMTLPWRYPWDRKEENFDMKPDTIPPEMRR